MQKIIWFCLNLRLLSFAIKNTLDKKTLQVNYPFQMCIRDRNICDNSWVHRSRHRNIALQTIDINRGRIRNSYLIPFSRPKTHKKASVMRYRMETKDYSETSWNPKRVAPYATAQGAWAWTAPVTTHTVSHWIFYRVFTLLFPFKNKISFFLYFVSAI